MTEEKFDHNTMQIITEQRKSEFNQRNSIFKGIVLLMAWAFGIGTFLAIFLCTAVLNLTNGAGIFTLLWLSCVVGFASYIILLIPYSILKE